MGEHENCNGIYISNLPFGINLETLTNSLVESFPDGKIIEIANSISIEVAINYACKP